MKKTSFKFPGALLGMTLCAFFLAPCQTACSPRTDTPPAPVTQDRFAQIDANGDGKVVLEEFQTAFPNMNEQAFIVIDRNKDKGIDRVEWMEFMENHGKSQKAPDQAPVMNNMPGDPLIPPVDSSDLPLMRPPAQ